MNAAETAVFLVGGGEFWAKEGALGQSMAEAFWAAGCEVVYFECGGAGELFKRKTAGLKMNVPDVYAHPERERFYLARVERLPGLRLTFPGAVRRWGAGRVSRKMRAFLSWPSRAESRALIVHYGWFFPEVASGRDWRERRVYECVGDHAKAPGIRESGWKQRYVLGVEKRLLARADLSCFTAPELLGRRRELARRAELVPAGTDPGSWKARAEKILDLVGE
jgi:hypothetical protein